ncbi:MAG: sugar phosphate nucleotidyltransferase [Acidobacteriota bacterium]
MNRHAWAIVLAGGDGQRVAALTVGNDGRSVPKQYCAFGARDSMIRWAFARALKLVPRDHILFVVADHHRGYWETELSDVDPKNILVQPQNRGTAVGVLLAVSHVVFRRDARARVLLLPSDHFVADEEVLREALAKVLARRRLSARRIVLLGMTPEVCDPEYGWILPAGDGAAPGVAQFAEKPSLAAARSLMDRGAMINSFMIVAQAMALVRACGRTIPELVQSFVRRERAGAAAPPLTQFYESLPSLDLSRDVLTKSAPILAVVRVPACGWSDLGTPARLHAYQGR